MRNHVIILDKSTLAHNIYQMILADIALIDEARHTEDLDVLMREGSYDLLIMANNSYSQEAWKSVVRRNKGLKTMPKVMIGTVDVEGFSTLKRPFRPNELKEIVGTICMKNEYSNARP